MEKDILTLDLLRETLRWRESLKDTPQCRLSISDVRKAVEAYMEMYVPYNMLCVVGSPGESDINPYLLDPKDVRWYIEPLDTTATTMTFKITRRANEELFSFLGDDLSLRGYYNPEKNTIAISSIASARLKGENPPSPYLGIDITLPGSPEQVGIFEQYIIDSLLLAAESNDIPFVNNDNKVNTERDLIIKSRLEAVEKEYLETRHKMIEEGLYNDTPVLDVHDGYTNICYAVGALLRKRLVRSNDTRGVYLNKLHNFIFATEEKTPFTYRGVVIPDTVIPDLRGFSLGVAIPEIQKLDVTELTTPFTDIDQIDWAIKVKESTRGILDITDKRYNPAYDKQRSMQNQRRFPKFLKNRGGKRR